MEKSKISLVIVMLTIKDSQILTKETYIMRGFLMENSKISLVIVMLSTKYCSETPQQRRGNVMEKARIVSLL